MNLLNQTHETQPPGFSQESLSLLILFPSQGEYCQESLPIEQTPEQPHIC